MDEARKALPTPRASITQHSRCRMNETNTTPSRVCTGCKNTLLVNRENFHAAPAGKYGFKSKCKACCDALYQAKREETRVKNKAKYEANKGSVLAAQKAYYRANRDRISAERREAYKDPAVKAKKSEHAKAYREKYREEISARDKAKRAAGLMKLPDRGAEHYAKIRDKALPYMRAYREANREKLTQYQRQYKQDNWPELLRKKQEYKKNNFWVAFRARVGGLLRKKMGPGAKAGRCQQLLLGYTREDLANHLESHFTDGMTWERFMAGEIHIDHRIPVSYFRPESEESPEFRMCWSLTNLRPLWAADNLAKADSLPDDFEELLAELRREVGLNDA